MFALFPILGITQGFIPIAGNPSLKIMKGSRSIQISIKYAALLASLILFLYFTMQRLLYPFTTDPKVIAETPDAPLGILQLPIIAIQLIELLLSFRRREMLRKRCC
jgi:hypothetical protein